MVLLKTRRAHRASRFACTRPPSRRRIRGRPARGPSLSSGDAWSTTWDVMGCAQRSGNRAVSRARPSSGFHDQRKIHGQSVRLSRPAGGRGWRGAAGCGFAHDLECPEGTTLSFGSPSFSPRGGRPPLRSPPSGLLPAPQAPRPFRGAPSAAPTISPAGLLQDPAQVRLRAEALA